MQRGICLHLPTNYIPLAGRDKNKTCQSAKTRAIIIVFIVRGRGARILVAGEIAKEIKKKKKNARTRPYFSF